MLGKRRLTEADRERDQRERELRRRRATIDKLLKDIEQLWIKYEELSKLHQTLEPLVRTDLTPKDLPYPSDYEKVIILYDAIGSALATVADLEFRDEIKQTKKVLKRLISLRKRLPQLIGKIDHLLWNIKGKIKHRIDEKLRPYPKKYPTVTHIVKLIDGNSYTRN